MQRRVTTAARAPQAADVDAWWQDVAPQVEEDVSTTSRLMAALAVRWLAEHARLNGVRDLSPVRSLPTREQIATSLRVTGPVAWKQHFDRSGDEAASTRTMLTRLTGSAVRLALAGDRSTTAATIWGPRGDQRIVGWRRVLGPNPCAWCAMIASRGAVYRSRATAAQQPRSHNHDHCKCSHEPLYEREAEPAEVAELREEWREVTAGLSGHKAISAWSRHWSETRTVSGF